MSILSRRERAEKAHPQINWKSYDAALHREAAVARVRLGAGYQRRFGKEELPITDSRSEEQKMTDNALIKQGNALMKTAWNDLEEVKSAVYAAYRGGSAALDNAEMKAVALIAFNLQLDPSPGVGHLYAWKDSGKFILQIGYQGYVHKANQQYRFVHHSRPMTESERQAHGLKDNEIGAICEIYEVERIEMWRKMGLEPKPITGSAVWRPARDSDNSTRKDNIPQGRSPLWVAEKNALKDAIRQLGIGFGSMIIPEVEGLEYDRENDGWSMPVVENPEPEPEPEQPKAEEPVDADFDEAKADTVGVPVGHRPEAEETKTEEPKVKPTNPRPYPAAQFQSKFQIAVNTYLMRNPDGKAKIKDTSVVENWFAGSLENPGDIRKFVNAFLEVKNYTQITEAQATILAGKILSVPEHAKVEIEQWMKFYRDVEAQDNVLTSYLPEPPPAEANEDENPEPPALGEVA